MLKNVRIYVNNIEESLEVQNALFKEGNYWYGGCNGDQEWQHRELLRPHILFVNEDGMITWAGAEEDENFYYTTPRTVIYYNFVDKCFQETPYTPITENQQKTKEKSTGGDSSYYDVVFSQVTLDYLKKHGKIKTEHLIKDMFGNDFDFGTALKSLKRAYEITQGGGKEGNDLDYELNKVTYYTGKIKENN